MLVCSCISGCGGGTTGSGGGAALEISGNLKEKAGNPLPGAVVSVAPSGTGGNQVSGPMLSAITGIDGSFVLVLDRGPTDVALRVQSDDVDASFQLTQIPIAADAVRLELILDKDDGSLVSDYEEFEQESGSVLDTDDYRNHEE